MKEKSAENAIHAYLSGILAHKGGSVTILNDSRAEFKNKVIDACNQIGIKRLFSNPFHPQVNSRKGNVYNFLKYTLIKFLECSDLQWDGLLPFSCYCYNVFPSNNGHNTHSS